jgi:hypothetical protein
MVQLTDDDSLPRVGNATERSMHLCGRVKNGTKYSNLLKPFHDDFEAKRKTHESAEKSTTFSLDVIKLSCSTLDDTLRDILGRAKEVDRHTTGSHLEELLFPEGLTPLVNLPDKEKPAAARAISLKITSLGAEHTLHSFVAQIETATKDCDDSFAEQETAKNAEGDAHTALTISKVNLVKQYNTNFHIAAADYGNDYAEKLFPQIRTAKKEEATKKPTV